MWKAASQSQFDAMVVEKLLMNSSRQYSDMEGLVPGSICAQAQLKYNISSVCSVVNFYNTILRIMKGVDNGKETEC
jgi:hypothetical protein